MDPRGLPVPGARVRAMSRRRRGAREAICDALGRFELRLTEDQLWLSAAPPRGAAGLAESAGTTWRREAPAARHELSAPLVLAAGVALVGVVRDEAGEPIPEAGVRATSRREGEGAARSDARGAFRIEGLKPGRFVVTATASGFVTGQGRAALSEQGGSLELVLEAGGQVEGVVRDVDGQPLERASVFAYRGGERLGVATSDPQGAFELDGLGAGPLELFARSRDRHRSARVATHVVAGQTTEVPLVLNPAAAVRGALRSPSGEPLAGWELRAESRDGQVERRARSDAQGVYELQDLYPGRYRIGARPREGGADLVTVEVEVAAGSLRRDLVAPSGARVAGQVLDPEGAPVAKAALFAVLAGETAGFAQSDDAGRFLLKDLPAGSYQLFARLRTRGPERDHAGSHSTELRAGESLEDVVVTVAPAARIVGRVLGLDGVGLAGVSLEVVGLEGPVERGASSADDGTFAIGPLYAGSYELRPSAAGLEYLAQELGVARLEAAPVRVRIEAGQDAQVALRLRLASSAPGAPGAPSAEHAR